MCRLLSIWLLKTVADGLQKIKNQLLSRDSNIFPLKTKAYCLSHFPLTARSLMACMVPGVWHLVAILLAEQKSTCHPGGGFHLMQMEIRSRIPEGNWKTEMETEIRLSATPQRLPVGNNKSYTGPCKEDNVNSIFCKWSKCFSSSKAYISEYKAKRSKWFQHTQLCLCRENDLIFPFFTVRYVHKISLMTLFLRYYLEIMAWNVERESIYISWSSIWDWEGIYILSILNVLSRNTVSMLWLKDREARIFAILWARDHSIEKT